MPDVQPNRPVISVSPQPQQSVQIPSNYMPGLSGPRMPLPLPYNLSAPSTGQVPINVDATNQYHPTSLANMPSFPPGGPAWPLGGESTKAVIPGQQTVDQNSLPASVTATLAQPKLIEKAPSIWIEHTNRAGKRYYYNRKTKLSSWEKPLELMTADERADATTDWREITAPDGRKYYYNRVTKQSKWRMPDEVKFARERAKIESTNEAHESFKDLNVGAPIPSVTGFKATTPDADSSSPSVLEVVSSPVLVAPIAAVVNSGPEVTSGLSSVPMESSDVTMNVTDGQTPPQILTPILAASGGPAVPNTLVNNVTTAMSNSDENSAKDAVIASDGVSAGDVEEDKKSEVSTPKANVTAVEDKTVDQEPLVYENKLDAKNAFRALLETANIASDWTWDQAMRVIINDRRYGALKTLGERKQAFNEFLGQKKKQEAEERRSKQKRAREYFKKMLEESNELTASTRWSKAIAIFEDDDRFKAVERSKEREDLFEDYLVELEKKERAKVLEEHKRNRVEYIEFLKSCDFIKASSQWRKVQDRLEADEKCSRLEKIDRLEIFQEYLRDLEKEEEEQRKLRMEELRKAERKNRDEFRKLMEGHIAAGTLTTKTHWREYCLKVKDLPAYLAVSSNTSGATPKDLFEDVAEELEKQYLEDKDRIKEAVKMGKIAISSTWTLEIFKAAILEDIRLPPVSDANLKLVFDELLERVREKEEKEAKKRKRLEDEFFESLCAYKEITSTSRWDDCKILFEDRQESWFNMEESFFKEIFEKYIAELKEKAREKERRRREDKAKKEKEGKERDKRKEKHRRDKERAKGKERSKKDGADSENGDRDESYSYEENKRSGRDKEKKHRKRHQSSLDDMNLDENDKDRSKDSHRHSVDRKKSKQMEQHAFATEADYDSRHKRYKRDHGNGSHRHGDYDEQKEREFGEDGEVW